MFSFLFNKRRNEQEKKIIIDVARRELELMDEIDEICRKKLQKRREKISASRINLRISEKELIIEGKPIKIKNYRNGKHLTASCDA